MVNLRELRSPQRASRPQTRVDFRSSTYQGVLISHLRGRSRLDGYRFERYLPSRAHPTRGLHQSVGEVIVVVVVGSKQDLKLALNLERALDLLRAVCGAVKSIASISPLQRADSMLIIA